jgi:hypothetical protein
MVISPRPFGQVLNDAMIGLGRAWRALLVPAMAASVPVSVLTVVIFRLTGGTALIDLVVNSPESLQTLPSDVFWELARPFYIAVGISTFLQLLAGVFVALASHRAVIAELKGRALTGAEATRQAMRRYGVGLAAILLIVFSILVLISLGVAVWLVPIVAVGIPNPATGIVALLLLVVLLGPGVWAGVVMSMTTSVVAIEGKGVLGSIRRSMRLVGGRWWATAGFLLLVGLLGGIAIQLIQLIALPLAAVGGGGAALTVASALGVLTQGLLVAAISAMYTHWYVDLRARREELTTDDLG